MKLDTLDRFDRRTAEGILAAAALATAPDPGLDTPSDVPKKYSREANDVLSEIRSRLRISPSDNSNYARVAIDNALANSIKGLVLDPKNTTSALGRAGQSGRLSPVLYTVIQSREFTNLFSSLGVSTRHVEDAVKHPDDHQHLMTEGVPEEAKTISLFMKRIIAKEDLNSHWLLVQTNRNGLEQHVQAAWRIYPKDVDLSEASLPLDVLKAFAQTFGYPISVGGKKSLFVDPQNFPFDAQVEINWTGAPEETFVTFSQTVLGDTKLFKIGIAYCIDIAAYRISLRMHGVKVSERPAAGAGFNRASFVNW